MILAVRFLSLFAFAAALGACAPRARPLTGTPTAVSLPSTELTEGRRLVFDWAYAEGTLHARGEGLARISAPDSARLDLFLAGGLSGGVALLIGDTLTAPGAEGIRRFLPPPELLWAAFGRLAVPAAGDTTAVLDGKVLRADIGSDPIYRARIEDGRLTRLERISGGRVIEWVARPDTLRVQYQHESARRTLSIAITRSEPADAFDATIWNP